MPRIAAQVVFCCNTKKVIPNCVKPPHIHELIPLSRKCEHWCRFIHCFMYAGRATMHNNKIDFLLQRNFMWKSIMITSDGIMVSWKIFPNRYLWEIVMEYLQIHAWFLDINLVARYECFPFTYKSLVIIELWLDQPFVFHHYNRSYALWNSCNHRIIPRLHTISNILIIYNTFPSFIRAQNRIPISKKFPA